MNNKAKHIKLLLSEINNKLDHSHVEISDIDSLRDIIPQKEDKKPKIPLLDFSKLRTGGA